MCNPSASWTEVLVETLGVDSMLGYLFNFSEGESSNYNIGWINPEHVSGFTTGALSNPFYALLQCGLVCGCWFAFLLPKNEVFYVFCCINICRREADLKAKKA